LQHLFFNLYRWFWYLKFDTELSEYFVPISYLSYNYKPHLRYRCTHMFAHTKILLWLASINFKHNSSISSAESSGLVKSYSNASPVASLPEFWHTYVSISLWFSMMVSNFMRTRVWKSVKTIIPVLNLLNKLLAYFYICDRSTDD
jgi:hypothetical protein